MKPRYKRILLKLSGEALMGELEYGISVEMIRYVAAEVRSVYDLGVQIAIVVGGGNLFRGMVGTAHGMDRASADHMGMLATVMNALALQDALERSGVVTRVQTAIEMKAIAEPYIRGRAVRHLEKGRVVILGAGTGNPYFTTDTAGALRAMEIDAEVLIKATKVDGVYDGDPKLDPNAKRYNQLSYIDAVNKRLKIMDSTAITLCMDNDLPIIVLNLWQEQTLTRTVTGESVGTLIYK